MKRLYYGFALLGAGLTMLIGLGVGRAIGQATAFAIEGVARQPEAAAEIRRALFISYGYTLVPFAAAFVVVLILICTAAMRGCKGHCLYRDCSFNRVMGVVGAAVTVLSDISSILRIGEATAHAVMSIARQPEALPHIRRILVCGNLVAMIPLVGALIIALLLLHIARKPET